MAIDVITVADGSTIASVEKGTMKTKLVVSLTDFQEFTTKDGVVSKHRSRYNLRTRYHQKQEVGDFCPQRRLHPRSKWTAGDPGREAG